MRKYENNENEKMILEIVLHEEQEACYSYCNFYVKYCLKYDMKFENKSKEVATGSVLWKRCSS